MSLSVTVFSLAGQGSLKRDFSREYGDGRNGSGFFFHPPSGARGIRVACSLSAVLFLGPKLGPIGNVLSAQTGVKLRQINESVDGSITQRSVVQSVTYVSGTICYLCLGSLNLFVQQLPQNPQPSELTIALGTGEPQVP